MVSGRAQVLSLTILLFAIHFLLRACAMMPSGFGEQSFCGVCHRFLKVEPMLLNRETDAAIMPVASPQS